MPTRPEYIRCILKPEPLIQPEGAVTIYPRRETICGRHSGFEFLFQDLEHARLTVQQGERLMPCEECFFLGNQNNRL